MNTHLENRILHSLQTIAENAEALEKQLALLQLSNKPILTLEEASHYLGVSRSWLYKKTSSHQIPFYKVEGGKLLFKTDELNIWLEKHRVPTDHELRSSNN